VEGDSLSHEGVDACKLAVEERGCSMAFAEDNEAEPSDVVGPYIGLQEATSLEGVENEEPGPSNEVAAAGSVVAHTCRSHARTLEVKDALLEQGEENILHGSHPNRPVEGSTGMEPCQSWEGPSAQLREVAQVDWVKVDMVDIPSASG
jgi:hypothetical protein